MAVMITEPLKPFTGLPFSVAVDGGAILGWVIFTVFAFWGLYTMVGIYHWIKYSHAAAVAYPAIFVHLAVSGALALIVLSGLVL
jgi:hypothetical protein